MIHACTCALGLPLAAFVVCFASAIVPLIHAELFLVGVSAVVSPGALVMIAGLATAGQILGKVAVYGGGCGALKVFGERMRRVTHRCHERLERWRHGDRALVFVSSLTGLPPFLFVSAAAGMMRIRLRTFVVYGFVGRLMRFGLVLAVPQIIRALA